MKAHLLPFLFVALLFTGCTADGLVGPTADGPSAQANGPSIGPNDNLSILGDWNARDEVGKVELTITESDDLPAFGTADGGEAKARVSGMAMIQNANGSTTAPTIEGTLTGKDVRLLFRDGSGEIVAKAEGEVNADFTSMKIAKLERGSQERRLVFTR